MREYSAILLERPRPYVLSVKLNRPAKANSLNAEMSEELNDLFCGKEYLTEEVRCVVMTGADDPGRPGWKQSFCAGADLKARDGQATEAWLAQHRVLKAAINAIMDCPVPTIAAVNGTAIGGGVEIALACDLAYASYVATFALTEASLGFMPGCGGTLNAHRLLGQRRAMELLLLSTAGVDEERHSASRMFEWGLLNDVVDSSLLMERVLEVAERIASRGPVAVRNIKQALRLENEGSLSMIRDREQELYDETVKTEDRAAGISAFWRNVKTRSDKPRSVKPLFAGR